MKKRIFLTGLFVTAAVLIAGEILFLTVVAPRLLPELREETVLRSLLVFLILLAVSTLGTYLVATFLVRPLKTIDPYKPENSRAVPEVVPLVNRIREQNRTIRQQNEIMARERQDFAAVTGNMTEGFLLLDKRMNIVTGNASARKLFPADGPDTENLNSNGCPEEISAAAVRALTGQHTELTLLHDGRYIYAVASPVAADEQITGAVVMLLDVTEREERDKLRREFTANVSHELKTPLTSIHGFAELLQSGMVEPERVGEFAGDIFKESQRMIQLVNDIMELSRLEENREAPSVENVDLYALGEEVLASLRPAAEPMGLLLKLEGDRAVVCGNRPVLREMLGNLCDNAVKYNRPGGSVTIFVRDTGSQVTVTVSDTGIGIPREHQNRVFERFYRVDKSHSRQVGGTGLGLSIVKHGALLHRAAIKLQSAPDRGTVISLSFPKAE